MKSLNPLKFLGTVLLVLSFIFINQNFQAQKLNKGSVDYRELNSLNDEILNLRNSSRELEQEYQNAKAACENCSSEQLKELKLKFEISIQELVDKTSNAENKLRIGIDKMVTTPTIVELNSSRLLEINNLKSRETNDQKLELAIESINDDFVFKLKEEVLNRKVQQSEKILSEYGYPKGNGLTESDHRLSAYEKDEWVAMNPELYEKLISTLKNTKLFLSTEELEILRTWGIDAK